MKKVWDGIAYMVTTFALGMLIIVMMILPGVFVMAIGPMFEGLGHADNDRSRPTRT